MNSAITNLLAITMVAWPENICQSLMASDMLIIFQTCQGTNFLKKTKGND